MHLINVQHAVCWEIERDACPSCGFVRIVPMWYDPLSNGEMYLTSGTQNVFNTLYAERRLSELWICSIRRNRAHVIQPIAEWRNASHWCPTRYMLRDACPSCRFVRLVRIVPMWYDPLSSGEMHLINVHLAVCWETLVRVVDSFESCLCDTTRCRMEKCISLAELRRLFELSIRLSRTL